MLNSQNCVLPKTDSYADHIEDDLVMKTDFEADAFCQANFLFICHFAPPCLLILNT